ncbi:DUF397 domain-containing protein [Streptacidiphilus sp. P02-A3a]|uniref:DUF397 domain-containing protein n=1 Tax=Streptacidiphilus sp. P02-A3a TaxID=2704468 RepID=UPI0015FB6CDC|nr:DUF397 domain-containing protein [Streptacidiphilus sp. P02-A3a]QMU73353.1 DUF397 domain-containing protein [Streptacidiphilus sp. P02-A3a]
MSKVDLSKAVWEKSSHSSADGQCVEVAALSAAVAVRDSKDPDGPALVFSTSEFAAFVRAVTHGGLQQP